MGLLESSVNSDWMNCRRPDGVGCTLTGSDNGESGAIESGSIYDDVMIDGDVGAPPDMVTSTGGAKRREVGDSPSVSLLKS